ncbi:hypothetical protein M5E87_11940 [Flavonifractor plautii]|nr:hypothetical protein M5E87_11940 [Flavonifractor plautii]
MDYARRMLELKNEAYRIIHDIVGRRRGTLSLPSPRSGAWRCSWPCTHGSIRAIPR